MFNLICVSLSPHFSNVQAQTVDGELEMWDCEAVVSSAEKQVSDAVKPVLKLQSLTLTVGWSLSPAGLLSLESDFQQEIQVKTFLNSSLLYTTLCFHWGKICSHNSAKNILPH